MSTAGNMIKLSSPIKIYGAGDMHRIKQHQFDGYLGKEIENFGELFYNIHKGCITLGGQATLLGAYQLDKLGEIDLDDFGQGVKEIVYGMFENKGIGNVTNDACDYDNGNKDLRKVKETDRSVRWIVRPEEFVKGDSGWQAKLGQESEVHEIIIPESGYVENTCDGSYRPGIGPPFSTVLTRAEAEKSWTDKGYSPEFAKDAVSWFQSRNEGEGTASVDRWYLGDDVGRFNVDADDDPDSRDPGIGSFPASRSAERSEAGPGNGIVVVSENEYNSVLNALNTAAEKLKSLNT